MKAAVTNLYKQVQRQNWQRGTQIRSYIASGPVNSNKRIMCEFQCCALLQDAATYQPDTFNLYKDAQAAEYWFPCFRDMITKFATRAAASQSNIDATAVERAEKFRQAYLEELQAYEKKIATAAAAEADNTTVDQILGTRELLELNEKQLRHYGFPDPWLQQKQHENQAAAALLEQRLKEIDAIEGAEARWTELVCGVLAGNMFDWGAQAVANILENDEHFGLHAALQRIQKRPWLMDNLDEWLQRVAVKPADAVADPKVSQAHKCAVIFVDNSGVDIVLGILPFARELLKRGTKVLLCANTEPSLNDVTSSELTSLINTCSCHCSIIAQAWSNKRLLVYGNGQRGPCLDMRTLPLDLCQAMQTNETDLLVIEGMGRALHTNLYAKFNCETLKLAVIKNKWLAQHLGGDIFAVMCKYERS